MTSLARTAAARGSATTTAAMFLRDGEWQSMTYDELWARVSDARPRARRPRSRHRRPRRGASPTPASSSRSSTSRSTPPGRSSSRCTRRTRPTSASGSSATRAPTAIVCENAGPRRQDRRSVAGRAARPAAHRRHRRLRSTARMSLDELAARGRAASTQASSTSGSAQRGVDDACLIIYTSGTTGRPKGVVLTNKGFAAGRRSAVGDGPVRRRRRSCTCTSRWPTCSPSSSRPTRSRSARRSPTGAATPTQIVAELGQVNPTVLPSVPRIFEKVYAVATGMIPPGGEEQAAAGGRARRQGSRRPAAAARTSATQRPPCSSSADRSCSRSCAASSVARIKLAISGAAPIAPEILEFFYAAGVPVMEGWGMTETTAIGTFNLPDAHKFGTIGQPVAGADVRIADDGEIEIAGEMLMQEYWQQPGGHGRRDDRRRLPAHRRPRVDRRRRLRLDHRPQEGHHHHGRRQEPHAGQPRGRPAPVAVDLAGGDVRRPQAVPGGVDHARRRGGRAVGRGQRAADRPRRARRRTRSCRR